MQKGTIPLQIHQDLDFQKRFWLIQRIIWVVFLVLIILAALGFFGDGPLSRAQAGQAGDGVWMEYARFGRYRDQLKFILHDEVDMGNSNEVIIQLDQTYLGEVEVNKISPAPKDEREDSTGVTYVFAGSEKHNPFVADFFITPIKAGRLSGKFRFQNGKTVEFSQFIYP